MTSLLSTLSFNSSLHRHISSTDRPTEDGVHIFWLGQAGFLIDYPDVRIAIDPYLSDYLAKKYAGKTFSHQRMMPAPLTAHELSNIDFVLCTHRHSDHMDPETLPPLMQHNPDALLIYPAAEEESVNRMGIRPDQRWPVNAGECIELGATVSCKVIQAAHELPETDEKGRHRFLGYLLKSKKATVYHSGDCIPYNGLLEELLPAHIDLALLPVNGRDDLRRKHNIPGNFHLSEAIDLCENCDIPHLIGHHHGMFAFNTLSNEEAHSVLGRYQGKVNCRLSRLSTQYVLVSDH